MFHNSISYGKQYIDDEDIEQVISILKSSFLTQGQIVPKFESEISKLLSSNYTIAVSSGTAALHLLGIALGWRKNDVVITSPITFLASANTICYSNATPDFVDINFENYTIDPERLEDRIKKHNLSSRKVKAVIAVDYAGHPCDWKSLKMLAEKYDFKLINDNCHALGAEFYSDISYALKYTDAGILSFHPVKHITTGEGGAVFTNDKYLADNINLLRNHGMQKNEKMQQEIGRWYYEMTDLGFNYRITDIQCALGISQLKKLDKFLSRRRKIANLYNNEFADDERFIIPSVNPNVKHAYHLYPLLINFDKLKITRKELFEKLAEKNVFLQVHYIPVHTQPYYQQHFGFKWGDYPNSEMFYEKEVSLPVYYSLTEDDQLKFINLLKLLCI